MDNPADLLLTLLIWVPPVLFAVTFHEIAHGWVANQLGDSTARQLGRLSPNPLKHVDLMGTIVVPILMYLSTGMVFGWAKPVPVTWQNLRDPRRDMALVAAAGPLANLAMAVIWVIIIKISLFMWPAAPMFAEFLINMGKAGIIINSILLVLNLLPVPPLDGSRIVMALLPNYAARLYHKIEPYGLIVLLVLLLSGLLGRVLQPLVETILQLAQMLVR